MSDTAVEDTSGIETLETAATHDTSANHGTVHALLDTGDTLEVEEHLHITSSQAQADRGHSIEVDIEGELDYDIVDGDLLPGDVTSEGPIQSEKTIQHQQQPPPKISWNEWAGSGDVKDTKPSSDVNDDSVIDVQRVPVHDSRRRHEEYSQDHARRSSHRRYHHHPDFTHKRESYHRDRSPVFRRHVPSSNRRSLEHHPRTGSNPGAGARLPPGMQNSSTTMTQAVHQSDNLIPENSTTPPPPQHGNPSTAVPLHSSGEGSGSIRPAVIGRTMPPGLGVAKTAAGSPPSAQAPIPISGVSSTLDSARGRNTSWRQGNGNRIQQQEHSPPPPPNFHPRERRDGFYHQYHHHQPGRFHRGRDGGVESNMRTRYNPDVSMNRRMRSPNRFPGPIPYSQRSFVTQNSRRGRFGPEQNNFYRRRMDRDGPPPPPVPLRGGGNRNTLSPRSMNRVPPSPRRVTLPVQRTTASGSIDESYPHHSRSKNDNSQPAQTHPPIPSSQDEIPHRSPGQRRIPSPGPYRPSLPPRRNFGPPHHMRRGPPPPPPRDAASSPPPMRQRRPFPGRGDYDGRIDRRPRGGGDFRYQGRPTNYNHHHHHHPRSLSPDRSHHKRQRANSQDRRPYRDPPVARGEDMEVPRPASVDKTIPGGDSRLDRDPLNYSETECAWFYVDPQGNTQGPCAIQQFRSWLKTLADDPDFGAEHQQFKSVSVWKEGMEDRYLMTELLDLNDV